MHSVPGPAHIKQASDSSSIRMSFGTALGFALHDRIRVTVLFIGDGALPMSISELETTARQRIPLVIVLMNDCEYGAELHFLKLRDLPLATTQFPDIDYAPVAEAVDFRAATMRTVQELRGLGCGLANPNGPVFIDCKIHGTFPAALLEETAPRRSRT